MPTAQKTKDVPLKEKFAKALRGAQRGLRYAANGGIQLSHEKNDAVLKGASHDIKRVRGLDLQIGALIKPFEGRTRVPENVTAKIDRHVKDVADSFSRIAAARLNTAVVLTDLADIADVLSGKSPKETPLRELEFISTYTSNAGNPIEQRLAKVRLG